MWPQEVWNPTLLTCRKRILRREQSEQSADPEGGLSEYGINDQLQVFPSECWNCVGEAPPSLVYDFSRLGQERRLVGCRSSSNPSHNVTGNREPHPGLASQDWSLLCHLCIGPWAQKDLALGLILVLAVSNYLMILNKGFKLCSWSWLYLVVEYRELVERTAS